MKRLHVHVSVDDLAQSTRFYSTMFAAAPTVVKDDYVKWMLDDPRVNFAISTRAGRAAGISHLGIQAEAKATTCCYAKSDKQWIADPQGVPWETFFTHGEATVYGERGSLTKLKEATERAVCCEPAALAQPEPEPASAEACCAPSCCAPSCCAG